MKSTCGITELRPFGSVRALVPLVMLEEEFYLVHFSLQCTHSLSLSPSCRTNIMVFADVPSFKIQFDPNEPIKRYTEKFKPNCSVLKLCQGGPGSDLKELTGKRFKTAKTQVPPGIQARQELAGDSPKCLFTG